MLNRKPMVVRVSIHQQPMASATATMKPIGMPATAPIRAASGIGSVCGMPLVFELSAWRGPTTSQKVIPATM